MNTASTAENCRERLALIGTDYDTLRAADPPVIAAALEKLALLDLALAMADQSLSPEIRDKAATDLLKWQRLNLARARLTFDKAKFEAAQKLAAEKNQPPFEASLEQQAYIMDKIDYMLGIPVKPRNPPGPVPQASLPAVPRTSESASPPPVPQASDRPAITLRSSQSEGGPPFPH